MVQLYNAYICIGCEEIFDVKDTKHGGCPRCAASTIHPLSKWVRPMRHAEAVPTGIKSNIGDQLEIAFTARV